MKQLIIDGGNELTGTINISGAKNSAVALIPASILSDEGTTIYNVPKISDIESLKDILKVLNCSFKEDEDVLDIDTKNLKNTPLEKNLTEKLRASYYFMGALLGKYKKCEISFPGGCEIGERPINLHLKGFEKLGAKITIKGDKYLIEAQNLKGADIYLDFASVGATINILLAAVKAEGVTLINNAAKEPEIVNVANLLNNMGAKITGAGTSVLRITGVSTLKKCVAEIIPDRIEAGTYLIIGALLGKNLKINGVIKEHLEAIIAKLREMGAMIEEAEDYIIINKTEAINPVNIKTLVYPGIPTDLGQPLTTALCLAKGTSIFEETLFEKRFGHIASLKEMGANITIKNNALLINGVSSLNGTEVNATDLRGGASLIVAGLVAKGETKINNVAHILRGYENITSKLVGVGAKISINDIN